VDFRVRLKTHPQGTYKEDTPLANGAVKGSRGIGEPPFVLAVSVFFAIKHAVMDARKDQGVETWLEIDAPATGQRIKESCCVKPDNMKL
jgi:xanthine dehydrogenase/oxidase